MTMTKLAMRDADEPDGTVIDTDGYDAPATLPPPPPAPFPKLPSANATIVERYENDVAFRKRTPHSVYARAKGEHAKETATDEEKARRAERKAAEAAARPSQPDFCPQPLRPGSTVVKTFRHISDRPEEVLFHLTYFKLSVADRARLSVARIAKRTRTMRRLGR
jgi:hypothetical protein